MEARKLQLPYLPDDLITEILLRSPLKSIGRFRCLSKLFCSLLSDPKFATKQLELTFRRRSDNRRLIMSSSKKLFLVDLDSMDVEREYSFKEDLNLLSKQTHIIESSNGLVCVRCVHMFKDKEFFLLYNPITRDSKIIPKLSESVHSKLHHQWPFCYRYGFCFDALTNDFKVVKLISCKKDEHKYMVCYVYSLKTDSWKRINHQLPYHNYVYDSSANLKGAIHWIAMTEGNKDQKVLMAFDLEKEELREMTLPNWAEEFDLSLRYFALDTLKGCLCVAHGYFKMHNVIWVMKEYGLESSWSKIRINVSEYSIKPTLCIGKNDEEVLRVFDGHFVYKKLKKRYEEIYMKMKASTYVESLISPNSYAEKR